MQIPLRAAPTFSASRGLPIRWRASSGRNLLLKEVSPNQGAPLSKRNSARPLSRLLGDGADYVFERIFGQFALKFFLRFF
jgi:hypothetical protein